MLMLATILIALGAAHPAPPQVPSINPPLIPAPQATPLARYAAETLGGFTIRIHPQASQPDPMRFARVRAAILFDLDGISRQVPAPALAQLRTIPIILTPQTPPRPGFPGHGACFHPSAAWLTSNGFDADRQGCVEIMNFDDLLAWRAEQPLMLLHELAHAYHWLLGFERPDLLAAYTHAKNSPALYRSVGYVLDPGGAGKPAYAITNHHEYFAELTEAFFGRNDYFPFTRADLAGYDPQGLDVVERLWSLDASAISREIAASGSRSAQPSPPAPAPTPTPTPTLTPTPPIRPPATAPAAPR